MKVYYPKLYNMAHPSLNVLLLPKDLTIIFYLFVCWVLDTQLGDWIFLRRSIFKLFFSKNIII